MKTYTNKCIKYTLVVLALSTQLSRLSTHQVRVTDHPCTRNCSDDDTPRVCQYKFVLESYLTMSKACYDCPRNKTDCFRPHCIAANGLGRIASVVNRQLPGPDIQVCYRDEIVVDVINLLGPEGTTIHWHGLHQRNTPFMDGVPMITQCPIPMGSTFRYRFFADNPGTHYWHSHSGLQRGDGVFGAFIVRAPKYFDGHQELYDEDRPDHVIILNDWSKAGAVEIFLSHHHGSGDNKPEGVLVNGKGWLLNKYDNYREAPLQEFIVEKGKRYRMRLISNGFLNCPLEFSVDDHVMTVISLDGSPIQPTTVDSFVIYAGERFDFILEANKTSNVYWIKLRGLVDCNERFTWAHQVALLRYQGTPEDKLPVGNVTYETCSRGGKQLNSLNVGSGQIINQLTMVDLSSMDKDDQALLQEPDYKFYLGYDFNSIDNYHFHHPEYYPIQSLSRENHLYTPQINNISMTFPSSPLLSQFGDTPKESFCNINSIDKDCTKDFCECVHMLDINLGSTVELVVIDRGYRFEANHPFHLHGTSFRVVAMKRLGLNTTIDEVMKLDLSGKIERKLSKAVLKDTVTVPDGGFTIIRFHAKNPGFWLFHCHIDFHADVGMAVVLKIGREDEMPKVPEAFPKCGDWIPDRKSLTNNQINLQHHTTSTLSFILTIYVASMTMILS